MSDLLKNPDDNTLQAKMMELERRLSTLEHRNVNVNALDELGTDDLGLMQAGEFRAGNGSEPGEGFSGTRIVYPSVIYNGEEYHIVGLLEDVLQFGLSALDGAGVFASGKGRFDRDALKFNALSYGIQFNAETPIPGVGISERSMLIGAARTDGEISFHYGYTGDVVTNYLGVNPTFDDDHTEVYPDGQGWTFNGDADYSTETRDGVGTCAIIPDLDSIETLNYSNYGVSEYLEGANVEPSTGYKFSFWCKIEAGAHLSVTVQWCLGSLTTTILREDFYRIAEGDWHQEQYVIFSPASGTRALISFTAADGTCYVDDCYLYSIDRGGEISFEPHPIVRGNAFGFEDASQYGRHLAAAQRKWLLNVYGFANRLFARDNNGRVHDMVPIPKPSLKVIPFWLLSTATNDLVVSGVTIAEDGTSTGMTGVLLPERCIRYDTSGASGAPAGIRTGYICCKAKVRYARARLKLGYTTSQTFAFGWNSDTTAYMASAPYYDYSLVGLYFHYTVAAAGSEEVRLVNTLGDSYEQTVTLAGDDLASAVSILRGGVFDVEIIVDPSTFNVTFSLYSNSTYASKGHGDDVPTWSYVVTDWSFDVYQPQAFVTQIAARTGSVRSLYIYRIYGEISSDFDDVQAITTYIPKTTTINRENPTTNYDANTALQVGESDGSTSLWRSLIGVNPPLIAFWYGDILARTRFVAVYLNLYCYTDNSVSTTVIEAHRILKAWVATEVTWNASETGVNWATAGAYPETDSETFQMGSLILAAAPGVGWNKIAIDAVRFQEMVMQYGLAEPGFFGLLLKGAAEVNNRYSFYSDANATNKPYFEIYTSDGEYFVQGAPPP